MKFSIFVLLGTLLLTGCNSSPSEVPPLKPSQSTIPVQKPVDQAEIEQRLKKMQYSDIKLTPIGNDSYSGTATTKDGTPLTFTIQQNAMGGPMITISDKTSRITEPLRP